MIGSVLAWEDEGFAGTLFPRASPRPGMQVIDGYSRLGSIAEVRAADERRLAEIQRLRERARDEEDREERWQNARQLALAAIKSERRMERLGIPVTALDDDLFAPFMKVMQRAAEQFAQVAKQLGKQLDMLHTAMAPGAVQFWQEPLPYVAVHQSQWQELANARDPLLSISTARHRGYEDRERYLPGTRHNGHRQRQPGKSRRR